MNQFHFVSLAAAMTLVGVSSGVVVGVEDFSYADGSIDAQAGGSGFNYDNFDGAVTTTTSDWDITGGAPTVASGALVTDNGSAKRELTETSKAREAEPMMDRMTMNVVVLPAGPGLSFTGSR